jgi:cyanophycin synthetase
MKESFEFIRDKLLGIGYLARPLTLANETEWIRYTAPNGKRFMSRNIGISVPFPNRIAKELSVNKEQAIEYAQIMGISTPETWLVLASSDLGEIFMEATERVGTPLIVKPSDATLSKGLTMDIDGRELFLSAIRKAREVSERVLVQRQVSGTEIRFTVLFGEVKSALVKQKAQLVGDGRMTVRELLSRENTEREKIDSPYLPYPKLDETNITLEVDYDYAPREFEVIPLSNSSLVSEGASIFEVIDEMDRTYIDIVLELANGLGDGIVAVDLLINDYKKPANGTNYVFLEFNMSPRLVMYYLCRNRDRNNCYDIAQDIAKYIDRCLKY